MRIVKKSPCNCNKKKPFEKQVNYFAVKAKDFKTTMPEFCKMLRSQVDNGSRNYVSIVPDDATIIMASSVTPAIRKLMKDIGYSKCVLVTGKPPGGGCPPGQTGCP